MFDFKGKTVIITGASHGIGKEIAKQYYGAGANIAVCSRDQQEINASAEDIGKDENRIFCEAADVSDLNSLKSFFDKAVQKFGEINIMVNNAGVQYPKSSFEVSETDWDKTLDTNLKGYFFGCQLAAKHMADKNIKGSIINIGSVNAVTVVVGQAVYASTKAAISQMTKSLAREWGRLGIRVNCVAPGSVPTHINAEIYKDPSVEAAMCEKIPMGRRGRPKEIADAVLYLSSNFSSYITGQTLFVDGGLTLVHG